MNTHKLPLSNLVRIPILFALVLAFVGCESNPESQDGKPQFEAPPMTKIVSLNGTLSEIIAALGEGDKLVGVDVTTTYPPSLDSLPRLGHSRTLSVEGVLGLSPTHIFGLKKDLSADIVQ